MKTPLLLWLWRRLCYYDYEDASVIIIMMWDPLTSDIATLVGGPDQWNSTIKCNLDKSATWDHNVFRSFVKEFMKIKLEASGPPNGYDTPEKLDQFIREEFELFGINVDLSNCNTMQHLEP